MIAATPLCFMPDYTPQALSAFTNQALTASTHRVAFAFQCPAAGTLNAVGLRIGTVTTGDTVRVSFQDVDAATGDPDGGVDQYRALTIAGGDANTWKTTGLITSDGTDTGTKRTVAKGDWLAIVIDYASYVAGSLNISSVTGSISQGSCYTNRYTGSWTKAAPTPPIALQYSDGVWRRPEGALAILSFTTNTINSGTTPDELALRFKLDAPARLAGAQIRGDRDGDYDLVLYDASSTVVASRDKEVRGTTGEAADRIMFASAVELQAGQVYRLAVKPSSGTNVALRSITLPSSDYCAAEIGGAEFYQSVRTDAGAWTDDQASKPPITLLLEAFEDRGPNRGLLTGGL